MRRHAEDPGVFIRSVASRGHLGGLSESIHRIVDVMDAAGRDVMIIETVGTGQSEVEVAEIADICVVVNAPNMGDDVQAMKAGVLEIADVLVVNKADLPLAQRTTDQLTNMLELRRRQARRAGPRDRRDQARPESTRCTTRSMSRLAASAGDKATGAERRMRRLIATAPAASSTIAFAMQATRLDDLVQAAAAGEIGICGSPARARTVAEAAFVEGGCRAQATLAAAARPAARPEKMQPPRKVPSSAA